MNEKDVVTLYKCLLTCLEMMAHAKCDCGNKKCENEAERNKAILDIVSAHEALEAETGIKNPIADLKKIPMNPIFTGQEGSC